MSASPPELRLPSPAKINRFLHVTGRREDGYHLLQTLFQFTDFGDWMTFDVTTDGSLSREDRHAFSLPAADLGLRAAALLRETVGRPDLGVRVLLEKRIPPGTGLGGGSSNAATTLLALNRLWALDLPQAQLLELARQLGADVPIFVAGEAAWAEGVGDELTPCPADEPWLAVLLPPAAVSTADAFNDPSLARDHPPVAPVDFLAGRTGNDLESVTFGNHPEVETAHRYLAAYGAARMSGTGGAVFVPLDSAGEAERIVAGAPPGMDGFVARALNSSPLLNALN